MMLPILGAGVVVLFVLWRLTSVSRGVRNVEAAVRQSLDPLVQRLAAGEAVDAETVAEHAKRPEARRHLYYALRDLGRSDLFPVAHLNRRSDAEARLCFWLMRPNELQAAPSQIEWVESVVRTVSNRAGEFLVFRYQMAPGHWNHKHGWVLGLVGPYFDGDEPYEGVAGAFSRADDSAATVTAADLVDGYVSLLHARYPQARNTDAEDARQ